MAVTRINNNQVTDAITGNAVVGINAGTKLQAFSITATRIANNLTYGSDLTIAGNLLVQGQTTTVDTVNTLIQDPLITLADGQTSGTPTVDIGTIGLRGTELSAVLGWKESQLGFVTALSNTTVSNTTFNISSYANLQTGNFIAQGTTSLVGNIIGAVNATATITGGNLATPGTASAAGNITGGNLLTAGLVSATGSLTGGNIFTAGNVSATGNVTGGNIIAGNAVVGNISLSGDINVANINATGYASVTGNVTGGNILTGGLASVTGNITGGNLNTAGTVIAATVNAAAIGNADAAVTAATVSSATIGNTGAALQGATASLTANVTGGNLLTSGLISASSTITGGNIATGGTVSATSTITGGNLVTGGTASVTGTITGGNLVTGGIASVAGNITTDTGLLAAFASVAGNVRAGNVITNTIETSNVANTTLTINAATISLNPVGNVGLNSRWINNLADPVAEQDAATKFYVDSVAQGLDPKASVVWGTAANLAPYTYNNGTSGVGATLTLNATGNLVIDGNVVASGQRVLVKNEVGAFVNNTTQSAAFNGIYTVTTAGAPGTAAVLTRSTDMNQPAEIPNAFTFVEDGAVNADTGWVCTTSSPVTIGTTQIIWTQFSGAGTFTAGNALSLNGTQFNVNVDLSGDNTVGINGSNQLYIPAGAKLTTPNIGAATGTSLSTTGTVTGGNLATGGTVSATGNATLGNVSTGGLISATGNVTAGNVDTGGQVIATNTITGGNLATAGTASAGGNITGANLLTGGLISATATITGGNLATGGTVSATGNATLGNVSTGGQVSATANVIGGNIITGGQVSATGNGTFGNISTAGSFSVATISASGNITGGNLLTGGLISATGTITSAANVIGGNVTTGGQVSATANVIGGNIITGGQVSATADITGNNIVGTTSGKFGNIVISGDDITDTNGRVNFNTAGADVDFAVNGDTVANVFYVDAGTGSASFGSSTQTTNSIAAFNVTTSIKLPVGNLVQRPSTGVTGMMRFNSTTNSLEIFNNTDWIGVGSTIFTVITDQQFNGDGVNVAFTLANASTTASTIVSINGVLQIPTSAYSVANVTLTFTEAPAPGDLIDVRALTTTSTVTSIQNVSGNASISVSDTSKTITMTGDLEVTGNVSVLGNIATDLILNGTSRIEIPDANGNIHFDVNSANDIMNIGQFNVVFTSNVIPSANVTYNLGTATNRWNDLYLANSTIYLGNAQISANATAIVMTNPAGGQTVLAGASATSSVAGNVTGGNILTGGQVIATGNVSGANLILTGNIVDSSSSLNITTTATNANIQLLPNGAGNVNIGANIMPTANATSNIGSATLSYNTIFAKATSAQYADLAEKYTADAEYAAGTVVVFGGTAEVTVNAVAGDTKVAGVVSTNPSYIMNSGLESAHVATVALTGRVPTMVVGPVRKGDLMVAAGLGRAQSAVDPKVGSVIGKALEDFDGAEGTIEVVVGRF